MTIVRINAYVWLCTKSVTATEDFASEDRVVRAWMRENGVYEGDRIQPVYVQINGMDDPALVWVVIAHDGLVTSIAEPPIDHVLAAGPAGVYFVSQPT